MSISENEVVENAYYITDTQQLRKVISIKTDDKSRTRVSYMSKSDTIENRRFEHTATLANPALLETFANACSKKLDFDEIQQRRENLIILEDE